MKHTPGKWDCGESIDGMWYVETDHVPGEMIAEIMMRAPGEAEANARLLDAAADAYEAEYNAARGISEADKD